jgi:hypothetical protein
MMSSAVKSEQQCSAWVQKVQEVQSKRTPEAYQAARLRQEQARQHEVSYRKCKAAKGHAVRSRALAAECLQQMAACEAPEEHMAVQSRWNACQMASKRRQETNFRKADDAYTMGQDAQADVLSDADVEEEQGMAEVAQLMGASDASAMAAMGAEGLAAPDARNAGTPRSADNAGTVESLLRQLRKEPENEQECAAKFMLYEGYGSEVEQMRNTLYRFYEESKPNVPEALASDMSKQLKGIDTQEAMGIPDHSREWFVYHMMRQAERNNLKMAGILDGFEKKLEFLAANDQTECPVCLEDFTLSGPHAPETLGCCHKVCKECWESWSTVMHGHPFCPLCRNEEFLGALASQMPGASPMAVDSD